MVSPQWLKGFFISRQVLARRRVQVEAAMKPQPKVQASGSGYPKASSSAAPGRIFNVFGEQVRLGTRKPLQKATSEGALKKVPDHVGLDVHRQPRVQFQRSASSSSNVGKTASKSQFAQSLPSAPAAVAPPTTMTATTTSAFRPSIKPASHSTENRGFEGATAPRFVPVAEPFEPVIDDEDSNTVFHSAEGSKFEFARPKAPPLPPPKPTKKVQKVRWVQ